MTDAAYRDLTPTQRAVRDAFVAELRAMPAHRTVRHGRQAGGRGQPAAVVGRTVRELRDIATRYWSGKGAAA